MLPVEIAADAPPQRRVVESLGVARRADRRSAGARAARRRSRRAANSPVGSSPPASGSSNSARRGGRASDIAQPNAAEQRAERCLDRRAQTRCDLRGITDLEARRRLRGADLRDELGVEIGGGEVDRLEARGGRACRRRAPTGIAASGGDGAGRSAASRRRRGSATVGGSSSTTRSSGSLCHPRLVRGCGDVAVGGAPPAAVEVRSKIAAVSVRRLGRAGAAARRREPSVERSTAMQPGAFAASASKRGPRRRRPAEWTPRAMFPSASRANSSRPSGEFRLSTSRPTRRSPDAARASARRTSAGGLRRAARSCDCSLVGVERRRPSSPTSIVAHVVGVGVVEEDRARRRPGCSPAPTGTGR